MLGESTEEHAAWEIEMMAKWLVLVTAVGVASTIACGATQPPSTSVPTPTPTPTATATSTPDPVLGNGAHLITSPCVVHAGSAHRSSHKDSRADASVTSMSCNFGAECFVVAGQPHAGDGFVSVTCEDTACRCEWTTPTAPAPLREPFTLAKAPDDSAACKRLLVERCMKGVPLQSG